MTIQEKKSEDTIQLTIEGRVDTVTAPQLQNAVLSAFQKAKNLVIDLNAVDYVSSAGLRALLIGQKTASSKGGSLKVTGVTPTVAEVFKATGFSKFLNIV